MTTPSDPRLYAAVKRDADARFLAKTGAYKSAWIVREYKKRGGTYWGPRPGGDRGLRRWFREKWIDVATQKACGRRHTATAPYPLCRPSVRVTRDTPVTVDELAPSILARAVKRKQRLRHLGRIRL